MLVWPGYRESYNHCSNTPLCGKTRPIKRVSSMEIPKTPTARPTPIPSPTPQPTGSQGSQTEGSDSNAPTRAPLPSPDRYRASDCVQQTPTAPLSKTKKRRASEFQSRAQPAPTPGGTPGPGEKKASPSLEAQVLKGYVEGIGQSFVGAGKRLYQLGTHVGDLPEGVKLLATETKLAAGLVADEAKEVTDRISKTLQKGTAEQLGNLLGSAVGTAILPKFVKDTAGAVAEKAGEILGKRGAVAGIESMEDSQKGIAPEGGRAPGKVVAPDGASGGANVEGAKPAMKVPELRGKTVRELYKELVEHVKKFEGTAQQKADLFEALAKQVEQKTGGEWAAVRGIGTDGSHLFYGQRGEAMVISPEGALFKGNATVSSQITTVDFRNGIFTPHYENLSPR